MSRGIEKVVPGREYEEPPRNNGYGAYQTYANAPYYPNYPVYPPYPLPNPVYPAVYAPHPVYAPNQAYAPNNAPNPHAHPNGESYRSEVNAHKKKPETQFQFNETYKKPLESFDFNEFKRNTLPMLRLGKLIKIQALARGFLTRKFILPFKRRLQMMALKIRQDLLEEFIEDNLLPEIILEIINSNFAYKDYSLYAPDFRMMLQIADWIENKVIHGLCEEVVKDITRFIVNDYLRKRAEDQIVSKKFDALAVLVDEFFDVILEKDLPLLVKELIKEEADEFLLEANMANIVRNQFIPIYCREVIDTACWEIAEEDFLDECLEKVIDQHINDVIIDSAEAEKDRVDLETLENAFNAFIQRSILKEAISQLVLMNQEYHDEEYLNHDKISEHELNDFVLDEKKSNNFDDFFADPPPKNERKISTRKIEEAPSYNEISARKDSQNSQNLSQKLMKNSEPKYIQNNFSGERVSYAADYKTNEFEIPENKNIYNYNPNFTAPKSPRHKKNQIPGENSEMSHGRRGTNTFYPNS